MVYVQDIDGKPMMPTTRHGKVRRLLKANKATVVNLCPFTIQLTYKSTDHKQPVTLALMQELNISVFLQQLKKKSYLLVKQP